MSLAYVGRVLLALGLVLLLLGLLLPLVMVVTVPLVYVGVVLLGRRSRRPHHRVPDPRTVTGMTDTLNIWTQRVAVFRPRRTDDLVPDVQSWIGRSFTVQYAGIIDTDWSEQYAGQRAWWPIDGPRGVTWIPDCDLDFAAI